MFCSACFFLRLPCWCWPGNREAMALTFSVSVFQHNFLYVLAFPLAGQHILDFSVPTFPLARQHILEMLAEPCMQVKD